MKLRLILATFFGAIVLQIALMAKVMSHGDVTPQAVDTEGLNALGDEYLPENPYRLEGGDQYDYSQNGAYKMPPYETLISQEAMWAIRSYTESQPRPE